MSGKRMGLVDYYALDAIVEPDYADAEEAFTVRSEARFAAVETKLEAHLERSDRILSYLQDRVSHLLALNTELESKVGQLQTELRSVYTAPLQPSPPSYPTPAEASTSIASKVEIAIHAVMETVEYELELTARERAAKELVARVDVNAAVPPCALLCSQLGLPPYSIESIRRGKQPLNEKVFWTISFTTKAFRDDAYFKRLSHFKRLQLDLRPSNTRRQRVQRRKLQSIEEVLSRYECSWLWSPSGLMLTLTQGNPLLLKDASHAAHVMESMNFVRKELQAEEPHRQEQAQARRQDDRGMREAQLPSRTHSPVRQADPATQPPGVEFVDHPMDANLPPHMTGPADGPPPGMGPGPSRRQQPARQCTATRVPAAGSTSGPDRGGRSGRGGRGGHVPMPERSDRTFRPYSPY